MAQSQRPFGKKRIERNLAPVGMPREGGVGTVDLLIGGVASLMIFGTVFFIDFGGEQSLSLPASERIPTMAALSSLGSAQSTDKAPEEAEWKRRQRLRAEVLDMGRALRSDPCDWTKRKAYLGAAGAYATAIRDANEAAENGNNEAAWRSGQYEDQPVQSLMAELYGEGVVIDSDMGTGLRIVHRMYSQQALTSSFDSGSPAGPLPGFGAMSSTRRSVNCVG